MQNFNTKFRFKLNTLQNIHVSTFLKDPELWISSNYTNSMRSPPSNDFLVHPLPNCRTYQIIPASNYVLGTSCRIITTNLDTFKLTSNAEFIIVALCKRRYMNPSHNWVAKHWPIYDILRRWRLLANVFVIVDIHILPGQNTPRSHSRQI